MLVMFTTNYSVRRNWRTCERFRWELIDQLMLSIFSRSLFCHYLAPWRLSDTRIRGSDSYRPPRPFQTLQRNLKPQALLGRSLLKRSCPQLSGRSLDALGPLLASLGRSWAALGRLLAAFWRSWGALGSSWAAFGLSWPLLGCCWAALGHSWAALARSWGALGTLLSALGAPLGRSWDALAPWLAGPWKAGNAPAGGSGAPRAREPETRANTHTHAEISEGGGDADFGSEAAPLTPARGYQDLKILKILDPRHN